MGKDVVLVNRAPVLTLSDMKFLFSPGLRSPVWGSEATLRLTK
jgi:hypothetical protein